MRLVFHMIKSPAILLILLLFCSCTLDYGANNLNLKMHSLAAITPGHTNGPQQLVHGVLTEIQAQVAEMGALAVGHTRIGVVGHRWRTDSNHF